MKRHYYISQDLDDLDQLSHELEDAGVATPQIHVLSQDDAGVAARPHLHPVEAVLKKNVVRGTEIGAVVGVIAAGLLLFIANSVGAVAAVGWVPFGFLAIVVLGFCTWEGGLFGIQEPHGEFKRFAEDLDAGRHIFFADLTPDQEASFSRIIQAHPGLREAGEGAATPALVVHAQRKFRETMQSMP